MEDVLQLDVRRSERQRLYTSLFLYHKIVTFKQPILIIHIRQGIEQCQQYVLNTLLTKQNLIPKSTSTNNVRWGKNIEWTEPWTV